MRLKKYGDQYLVDEGADAKCCGDRVARPTRYIEISELLKARILLYSIAGVIFVVLFSRLRRITAVAKSSRLPAALSIFGAIIWRARPSKLPVSFNRVLLSISRCVT